MTRAGDSTHWYRGDGSPCHTVIGKNGRRRNTWITDAREQNLYYSVTKVLDAEAKPQLTRWMVKQGILSALTLPRAEGESLDDFALRAEEDSKQQSIKAADAGTRVHAAVKSYFETWAMDFAYGDFITRVRDTIAQRWGIEGWLAEQSFAHPLGYGGQADLANRSIPIVIDFKGKEFSEDKTGIDLAWPQWCAQLAAYGDGLFGHEKFQAANIIFNRTPQQKDEPRDRYLKRLIRVREWDSWEIEKARKRFRLCLELTKLNNDYDPAVKQKPSFVSGETA